MIDNELQAQINKAKMILQTYCPISCTGKEIKEHSNILYNLFEDDKWKTAIAYGKSQGWYIGIRFYSDNMISHWMLCDLKKKHRTIYDAYQNGDIQAMKALAKLSQMKIVTTFQNHDSIEHSKLRQTITDLELKQPMDIGSQARNIQRLLSLIGEE